MKIVDFQRLAYPTVEGACFGRTDAIVRYGFPSDDGLPGEVPLSRHCDGPPIELMPARHSAS